MPAGDGLVVEIASAILDGAPIDWASASSTGDMNERTWLLGDAAHSLDDDGTSGEGIVANCLWTRRSALALCGSLRRQTASRGSSTSSRSCGNACLAQSSIRGLIYSFLLNTIFTLNAPPS